MKILYLSCHIVLEYDELRILNQLGHDVTVIGGYIDPKNPHVDMRPGLDIKSDLIRRYKLNKMYNDNLKKGIPIEECSNTLTSEILSDYDLVIIMHKPDWIEKNWEVLKNKKVVLRTIGQNLENNERFLHPYVKNGLKILRYSPKERELKSYAGEDGLIRFLKYQSDFKPRNLKYNTSISFGQHISSRKNWCGSNIIEHVASKVDFKLFGPGNNNYKFFGGRISYEQQLEELSTNSCYLYTGTFPAQYTLGFVEAFLSGIPIVSIGKNLSQKLVGEYPFEVPNILEEVGGFYDDDINKIVSKIELLSTDRDLNEKISKNQRKVAFNMFSVEENINLWNSFLNSI